MADLNESNFKRLNQKQQVFEIRYFHFAGFLFFVFCLISILTFPKLKEWIHAQNSSYFQLKLQLKIDQVSQFFLDKKIVFLQTQIAEMVTELNQDQNQIQKRAQLNVEEIDLNAQRNPASLAYSEIEYVENSVDYSFHEELKTLMNHSENEILFIGDSMLKTGLNLTIKKQLQKKLPDYKIQIQAEIGTGLARPEVYSWLSQLEKYKNRKIHTLVILLGTNDGQAFIENKKVFRFASESWDEKYSGRVKELANLGCEIADHVYWIGQLPMRDDKLNRKMQHINSVIEKSLNQHGCATWVDSRQWLSGENGQFVAFQNELIEKALTNKRIRQEDGIHLTLQGADIVSKKIIQVMQVTESGTHK